MLDRVPSGAGRRAGVRVFDEGRNLRWDVGAVGRAGRMHYTFAAGSELAWKSHHYFPELERDRRRAMRFRRDWLSQSWSTSAIRAATRANFAMLQRVGVDTDVADRGGIAQARA